MGFKKYLLLVNAAIACHFTAYAANTVLPYTLGGTYDSLTAHPTILRSCLREVPPPKYGSFKTNTDFSFSQSEASIQKAIGVEVAAKVGWGPLSVETSYNYGKTSREDALNLNVSYSYNFTGNSSINTLITPSMLIPEANVALGNPTKFRELCGDKVVTALSVGYKLLLALNLQFRSSMQKDSFQSEFKKSSGLSGVLSMIRNNNSGITFDLRINAMQLGGKPEELQTLLKQFTSKEKINFDTSNGFYSLHCDYSQRKNCANAINLILDYAGKISNQVSPNNYYTYAPVAEPWNKYFNTGDAELNQAAIEAKNKVTSLFKADQEQSKFIDLYLRYLSGIPKSTASINLLVQYLKAMQLQYGALLKIYTMPEMATMDCYNGFITNKCNLSLAKIEAARNQMLAKSDLTILKYLEVHQYAADFVDRVPTSCDNFSNRVCRLIPISFPDEAIYALECPMLESNTEVRTKIVFNPTNASFGQQINYRSLINKNVSEISYTINSLDKIGTEYLGTAEVVFKDQANKSCKTDFMLVNDNWLD